MELKDNKNITEENTKKVKSFWLGLLIGLGGWIVHVIFYTVFILMTGGTYNLAGQPMSFFDGITFFGTIFLVFGWEVIAIIAGVISKTKGIKKALSFIAIMVVILSFVVGGCTGLMSN